MATSYFAIPDEVETFLQNKKMEADLCAARVLLQEIASKYGMDVASLKKQL